MKIYGLNKTTLLDYPGRVAATIFLGGCNFRCPFCQNSSLVLNPSSQPELSVTEVLSFLKKRQGILEGVCVTGGEPALSPDLPEFLAEIRALGYPVKLDTNGTRPDLLKELAGEGLIQMAAVDIKACPDNYPSLCGLLHPDLDAIKETVGLRISYNRGKRASFRTGFCRYRKMAFRSKSLLSPGIQRLRRSSAAWIQQLLL